MSRINSSENDTILICQWQAGNELAFDELYKKYVLDLLGMTAKKIGSVEIAREIVQEVFLAICLQKKELQNIDDLRAYLYTIAKNKIYNYYRHQLVKRNYERIKILEENTLLLPKEESKLETQELQRLINAKLELLPLRCREVFKLSRLEKLSYKSIAIQMNISENTVDQHIRKALKILRHSLRHYYIPLLYYSLINMASIF